MPPLGVSVARPTRWGNPWKVGEVIGVDMDSEYEGGALVTAELAVALYEAMLRTPDLVPNVLHGGPPVIAGPVFDVGTPGEGADLEELRGHDLGCWCPLDQPCHADVLLRWANDRDPF